MRYDPLTAESVLCTRTYNNDPIQKLKKQSVSKKKYIADKIALIGKLQKQIADLENQIAKCKDQNSIIYIDMKKSAERRRKKIKDLQASIELVQKQWEWENRSVAQIAADKADFYKKNPCFVPAPTFGANSRYGNGR